MHSRPSFHMFRCLQMASHLPAVALVPSVLIKLHSLCTKHGGNGKRLQSSVNARAWSNSVRCEAPLTMMQFRTHIGTFSTYLACQCLLNGRKSLGLNKIDLVALPVHISALLCYVLLPVSTLNRFSEHLLPAEEHHSKTDDHLSRALWQVRAVPS